MQDPILVTGAARSGTSLIAGILSICGVFGGKMAGPTHHNRKGMFENTRIREDVVKPFLKSLGVDPMGQYPLPDIGSLKTPRGFRGDVERIICEEGYKGGPWMYKGAKECLIWPVWKEVFPHAKWVVVRRDKDPIVSSCLRTGFMKAFRDFRNCQAIGAADEKEGWSWWVNQHEKRFEEMRRSCLDMREVCSKSVVEGKFDELRSLLSWLGLPWHDDIFGFVDRTLWHN